MPLKFYEGEIDLYQKHFECLSSWNENINLVSKNSLLKAFATHYLDSIYIVDFASRMRDGLEVIDLGSGAGFPGLIHAIRFPDVPITLYEKVLKKQSFLSFALSQLDLQNVTIDGLLPDVKMKKMILARAVYPPPELLKLAQKRLVRGGKVILNLGGSTELPAIPQELSVEAKETYTLPDDCGSRQILCLSKK